MRVKKDRAWKTESSVQGTSSGAHAYPDVYPNFNDLLDSPDADDGDDDGFEDFLDMMAANDTMSAYPGYGVMSDGSVSMSGDGYSYPVYQMPSSAIPWRNDANDKNKQDVYLQGEQLVHNLENFVSGNKTATKNDGNSSKDTMKMIAQKVGILPTEPYQLKSELMPMDTDSKDSHSSGSDKSVSVTKQSPSGAKRKHSPSPASRSPRPKKDDMKGNTSEDKLYEDAKAKPIKHRKEPDIEETKDRSVKNALNARVNRQKHKLYVENLEKEVENLKKENELLETKHLQTLEKMNEMQKHIQYLKNVIENDTSIAKILTSVGTIKDIRLSSTFSDKSKNSPDSTSNSALDTNVGPEVGGGVCLHVDKNNVAVEFCEKCASQAYKTFNDNS